MATNENYENEMTVLQLPAASDITLADILYLLQGTGADRDKKMTLEQLRDFLHDKFTKLKIIGTDGNCELTSSSVKFNSSAGGVTLSYSNGLVFSIGSDKGFFRKDSFGFDSDDGGATGQVTYNSDNQCWELNIACHFDEGAVVYGDCQVIGGSLKTDSIDVAGAKIVKETIGSSKAFKFQNLIHAGAGVATSSIKSDQDNGQVAASSDIVVSKDKKIIVQGENASQGGTCLATPQSVVFSSDIAINVFVVSGLVKGEHVLVWNNGIANHSVTFNNPAGGTTTVAVKPNFGLDLVCYSPSELSFFAIGG